MKVILLIGLIASVIYYFFIRKTTALIVIDMQNDFCPGGSLGVTDGDKIIRTINRLIKTFISNKRLIIFSRDWHPKNTSHFKSENNPNGWPVHCVQRSTGAQFHYQLEIPMDARILSKGMGMDENAYSAFDEKANINGVNLHTYLKKKRVNTIVVCGLATDYCVKQTVLDGLKLGYYVIVIEDAIKAVNIHPTDGEKAIEEMKNAGTIFFTPAEVI